MENTFEYRYFLFLNYTANKMLNHKFQNFAELIKEEKGGRFMNSQMTFFFHQLDDVFSELQGNDVGWIFDYISIDELSVLTPKKLEEDYQTICVDKDEFIKFKF